MEDKHQDPMDEIDQELDTLLKEALGSSPLDSNTYQVVLKLLRKTYDWGRESGYDRAKRTEFMRGSQGGFGY